jgi:hypothetical protein
MSSDLGHVPNCWPIPIQLHSQTVPRLLLHCALQNSDNLCSQSSTTALWKYRGVKTWLNMRERTGMTFIGELELKLVVMS